MNIVFDLGGVVFEWQPDKIISGLFNDEKIKLLIKQQIFQHPDWLELDRGTLTTE
ncbi:MAG TPA: HAD family phosphatase, partial [Leucothrix sp.]|nr:HAD family phosphatase [Leucothrix sp.]